MTSEGPEIGPADEAGEATLPHTPPFGIKAVHPGDEPPVTPPGAEEEPRRRERPAGNGLAAMASTIGVVLAIGRIAEVPGVTVGLDALLGL